MIKYHLKVVKALNKKCFIISIILISIFLISCSNGLGHSEKINVNLNNLKFNEETSDSISAEHGILFMNVTHLFINWFNTYVENPNDEKLYIINDTMDKLIIEDMNTKSQLGLFNKYEEDIFAKYLTLSGEISLRMLQDAKIRAEEFYREQNLKELDDLEFEKLKNNKEQHIKSIKEGLKNILETYYDY